MGTIVVGYVPKPEGEGRPSTHGDRRGEAAQRAARGGQLPPGRSRVRRRRRDSRPRPRTMEVRARAPTRPGVEHEVRQLVRGIDPADDLVNVATEVDARVHRDRPAPPLAGRQADPGQQRAARAARRAAARCSRSRPATDPASAAAPPLRQDEPMAIHITGDAHADQVLTDAPVRAARRDDARPAVPDGARLPRARPRCWTGSAPSTRRRSRPPTPRSSRRCAPRRRRSTGSPARWRRGCRRWPRWSRRSTTATPSGSGPRRPPARSCCSGCRSCPGFGKQKAQIFVALLAKQLGVRPEGWEAGGRRLRRGRLPVGRRRGRRGVAAEGAGLQEAEEGRREGARA